MVVGTAIVSFDVSRPPAGLLFWVGRILAGGGWGELVVRVCPFVDFLFLVSSIVAVHWAAFSSAILVTMSASLAHSSQSTWVASSVSSPAGAVLGGCD